MLSRMQWGWIPAALPAAAPPPLPGPLSPSTDDGEIDRAMND